MTSGTKRLFRSTIVICSRMVSESRVGKERSILMPMLPVIVPRLCSSRNSMRMSLSRRAINSGPTRLKESTGCCGIGSTGEIVFWPMKWVSAKQCKVLCSSSRSSTTTTQDLLSSSLLRFPRCLTGSRRFVGGQTCTSWCFTALLTLGRISKSTSGSREKASSIFSSPPSRYASWRQPHCHPSHGQD